jgi:hypothetical protein
LIFLGIEVTHQALERLLKQFVVFTADEIADVRILFRNAGKPMPVVYLLPDAPHYFYISDESFVFRVTREFLLEIVGH